MESNPTLKGHKLMLLLSIPAPDSAIDLIRSTFPDLKIFEHRVGFYDKYTPEVFPEEEWLDVTILLTLSMLPTRAQAPKLQYVQLTSAGANHVIGNPLFTDTDVALCTANGVHGPQISEWVITTFLMAQHSMPAYLEKQREGKWERLHIGNDLEDAVGQRVGILGYGSIGRQVARVAKAMGMDVHAYTLHPRDTPESRRDEGWMPPGLGDPDGVFPSAWYSGTSTAELHAFLGSGLDLLVVAVPLTDTTRGLLGAAEFGILAEKKTFVSNIARGAVIKTDDIVEALDKGTIRGAALDVTDPEPLPEGHPLWKAKNLILTPHISGASKEYMSRTFSILQYNLERLSEGKKLVNKVNRREGY